jgi:hypothetical protein
MRSVVRGVQAMTSGGDALGAFLATDDLDRAADAGAQLTGAASDLSARIAAVIDAWSDRQGLANMLLCPTLIPPTLRAGAIERALRGDDGYLALMAAAGVGQVSRERLAEDERARLVAALLDLTASVDGIVARRAAASLGSLITVLEVPELLVMLRHSDAGVRRNILCALVPPLGTTSLAEILADRDEVAQEDAVGVTRALRSDGFDLDMPASNLRVLPMLDFLPNMADWDRPA